MSTAPSREFVRSGAAAMALPARSSWTRISNTVFETRDALMIIGYGLILRILVLARRWNY
ncbi:MAG: hypothetical protein WA755_00300 [Candidatus Acidiferrales bacterium]